MMAENATETARRPSVTSLACACAAPILGDTHVDRASNGATELDAPFQALITEAAWGTVWARPGWSKRERSIVTIALLAALGQDDEVAMHIRATRNTGATKEDICEALMHVAIYAGFRRRTTLSRSPSRPMRRWKRRKLKNEEQSAGNEPAFRSRSFHAPPAYTPWYKTSVLRSPTRALISLEGTRSEITGPVFGHNMLNELDNDLILNYARPGEMPVGPRILVHGRVLDEGKPAGSRRIAGILAGQCGRALSPQEGNLSRRHRSEFRRCGPNHHR